MSNDTAAESGGGAWLPLPLPDRPVFRYEAADDILTLLYRNPHMEFTVTELREQTGHGGKSVSEANEILASLGLIQREQRGRRSMVSLNRSRVRKPNDPILGIPQAEFHEPVAEFLRRIEEDQGENLVGVVLFGSVARGEADRTSDIDVQVIVEEDVVEARRSLQSIRDAVEGQEFDGDRYRFQLLVESVESVENYGEALREPLAEGITLYRTAAFDELKRSVLHGE